MRLTINKLKGFKNIRLILHVFLLIGILTLSITLNKNPTYAANVGDIVINELMYNPESGDQDDEFLELYNTTANPIDLTGWCFTDGITLVTSYSDPSCFNTGTIINSYDYLLVSPNPSKTQASYNKTAVASYSGTNLSNGGESLTLVDNNQQIIDEVTYDDEPPWPNPADGLGPSLELKDPSLDNNLAENWSTSVGGATPGEENSLLSIELPEISNVSDPNGVVAGSATTITANIQSAQTVKLVYRVSFDQDIEVAMSDNGSGVDTSANDGTYSAQIPAQSAGALVRFKIEATNIDGTRSYPDENDSINYTGYVVQDPQVNSNVEIIQWFMPDNEYTDMVTNHAFDDQKFSCVLAYGDKIFDNAEIWVKGGVKRVFDKKSFAIDLPQGYKLQLQGMERPVDEFHLDSDFIDGSGTLVPIAWQIAKEIGMDVPQVQKVRMQQNGQFFGMYTFLEEYDQAWRENFGYDSGAFYKTNTEKNEVNTDPLLLLQNWRENLNTYKSAQRRQYALDNMDIPNIVNYMAFMALIHNWEWHNGKNMNKYMDYNQTNRWKVLPQDIDGSMKPYGPINNLITPFEHGGYEQDRIDRFQFYALYEEEDFREIYFRRLRTLADQYLINDRYLNMYNELYNNILEEMEMDHQKWGTWDSPQENKADFELQLSKLKTNIFIRYKHNWAIPNQQSSTNISINADKSLSNPNLEHIVLTNNSNEAIDISGWKIPEIDYTMPAGSVIASGGTATVVKNDNEYKSSYPGTYLLGVYNNSFNDLGYLSLTNRDDTVIDDITIL